MNYEICPIDRSQIAINESLERGINQYLSFGLVNMYKLAHENDIIIFSIRPMSLAHSDHNID